MDIFQAAGEGDLERVRALVEQDHALVHAIDHTVCTYTPHLYAASKCHTEVVLYLLDHGAAINFYAPIGGVTALLLACLDGGNAQVVRVLLHRGADVTLVGRAERDTGLMDAAEGGSDAVVRVLLEHGGSDVDARQLIDWTAMHLAAFKGHSGVLRQLLGAGADPTLLDVEGYTAVGLAAQEGHQECVRILHDWDRAYVLRRARLLRDASTPQSSAQQGS